MRTALLIIDVQNIMFTYKGGVYNGEQVVDNIYTLLQYAREKSVPVIYIQHTDAEGPLKAESSEISCIFSM